jgi:hypothetical protein
MEKIIGLGIVGLFYYICFTNNLYASMKSKNLFKKVSAYILSIFFMIQIFTIDLHAQEETKEEPSYKHNININLGRLILNEARFSYEKSIKELHSLRFILGFQYPTSSNSFDSNDFPFYDVIPSYYKVSKGIHIGTGYNHISIKHRVYVSAEAYFSYNSYNKKYYHFSTGIHSDEYNSLESMKLLKTGIKFIAGFKNKLVYGDKMGLELDFFGGLGVQYRYEELTTFESGGHYSGPYIHDPPKFEIIRFFTPTVNMGILLGIPFGKN